MTAAMTITAPDAGSVPDGTAVDLTHFSGFNGIVNTGGCTWETDGNGERYILIPAGAGTQSLNLRPYNWTGMGTLSFFAMTFDVEYVRIAGPVIGDYTKTIIDIDSSTNRTYIQHRVFDESGVEVLKFSMVGGSNFAYAAPEFPSIPLGTRFTHGQTLVDSTSGGFGLFHNGRCVTASEGDTIAMQPGNMGRVELQSKASYEIRLYGPFKVWNTDFRAEAEFLPDSGYGTSTYESSFRHIPAAHFGAWEITTTGPASQIPTKYATAGTNPRRLRSVCSGATGDTITYTLNAAHKIGAANQYQGRMPFRPGFMLPSGASGVLTIGGDGMGNPLRVRFDGASGTAGARPVDFDPGTGTFGSTGITYDETHRLDPILILGDIAGEGSLIVHDLTEASSATNRVQAFTLDFDGLIDDIDTCTMVITMGTAGNPEFEGIANPAQIKWNLCSSYVSTNITSATIAMATANNLGLDGNFGQYAPDWFEEQAPTYNSMNPLGRSGLGLSTLAQEIGGFGLTGILPHLKHQLLCMLEWQANETPRWTDVSSYFEALVDGCITYGVEQLWATQLPVDDAPSDGDPTTDQIAVRLNNANLKAYLNTKAGQGVIYLSDVAALYTNAQAEALSSDDIHLTAAGFAEVGPLIESSAAQLRGLNPRSRNNYRSRSSVLRPM